MSGQAPGRSLAAVLWDMDGTLIDSEPIWIESQSRLVAEHGGVWTEEDALALVGIDMDATVVALQRAGVRLSAVEIDERLTNEVLAMLRTALDWRPGARELVQALYDAAIPQAIVTTSPRTMATIVADALPEGAIGVIVAGEDVDRGKPHPDPYLRAASHFEVDPARCVVIEDSPTGLAAAIAAGAVAVGVENGVPLIDSAQWIRLESLAGASVDLLRGFVARRGR